MARKRRRATAEILVEALWRLGHDAAAVDLAALQARLGLPDVDGWVEDEAVAQALAARAPVPAERVAEVVRACPGIRGGLGPDGGPEWRVTATIPILDDGRADLRIDATPEPGAVEILDAMARRNDPSWRRDELVRLVAAAQAGIERALRRPVERLRGQVAADLAEVGADAVTYIAHLDRSLRSRRFAYGPDLPGALIETLKPVRSRGRVLAQENSRQRRLRDRIGFATYIDRFSAARRLGRRIVFHMGPTNSGKTYAALRHLSQAATGCYLAPLRLLALENYETLVERGLRAGMVTGEEVLGEADPSHTARTIETADLRRPVDVAVIDEIQMIMDPDRGWAWTNALFGIPARTVVVCGSEDALSYVRRAAEAADESLDVVAFARKTPLHLMDEPVPLDRVEAGDAVVAFSRRAVHENRQALIAAGHSVATIYGALSPEVRRAEAARFRSGEAQVLVTTDAVGMGLNLGPLKRVVFSAVRKWDGTADRPLTHSEIRQVAGRAGRYGHQEAGYVAALDETGIAPLRAALGGALTAPAADPRFYVRPDLIAIEALAAEMGTQSLHAVLSRFALATFYEGSPFQPADQAEMLAAAVRTDRVPLALADRFVFAVCPIDRRDAVSVAVLDRWMEACSLGAAVPALRPGASGDLAEQERLVKLASAYLWLGRRFPDVFVALDEMRAMRGAANAAIEAYLVATAASKATGRRPRGPTPQAALADTDG
ncbi:helicase-related protein [Methylobacterium sp. Leaf466]|uniref:helicase-related protein n=1 Tax=Methylobacterium sp. Leaf466 TaxID=1736386 RepID=UPI0007014A00|nr:helicase-related protein [Methylobacterium sp. Leaf466]KQT77938.1 helicase [Methylobacterium sp. Leaf466]